MNVLVTGGAGYVGSAAVRLLLEKGHSVHVYDNLERGHRAAIGSDAFFIKGDLRDAESTLSSIHEIRPDAVMHFAAYAYVGESTCNPSAYYTNNVIGGINLLNAVADVGSVSHFVFSSSCATYGIPSVLPIMESAQQRPVNPYGDTKLIFESMLKWYAQSHRFVPVILRYFNACGAWDNLGEDHRPETHLIPLVLQTAKGDGASVRVFGNDYNTRDGTCIRDYIHIRDLAEAHLLALEMKNETVCNLGTGKGYSVLEIIDCARRVSGRDIPLEIYPRRDGDPPELYADNRRASDLLGWTPKYSDLETIINDAWCWLNFRPNGYSE